MRRAIIFGSSVAIILVVACLWPVLGGSKVNGNVHGAMCVAGHCCCTDRAEAAERLTLDPNQFDVPAKQAYQVAEKNPGLLAELHCYCGCDREYGHQNLLDCYRSDHGSKCEICIGEALMAQQLSDQGSPVDQIRDAIRRHYAGDN